MLLVKTNLNVSPIHGIGVFAGEFIPAGTILWRFWKGFDVALSHAEFNLLPETSKQWVIHFCYFSMEEDRYILCMDNAKHTNHSGNPNSITSPEDNLLSVAARDILAGEEITENYYNFDGLASVKLGK